MDDDNDDNEDDDDDDDDDDDAKHGKTCVTGSQPVLVLLLIGWQRC